MIINVNAIISKVNHRLWTFFSDPLSDLEDMASVDNLIRDLSLLPLTRSVTTNVHNSFKMQYRSQ